MSVDIQAWSDDEFEDETGEQQELFEHFHLDVDKGQAQTRIDKFLTDKIKSS